MFRDLEPREFCEIWIPKIYKIPPGTRGKGKPSYRAACAEFLSYICEVSPQTAKYWIDYPPENKRKRPYPIVLKYLRAIDLKLKELEQMPLLYQQFIEELRKKSDILK